MVEAESNEARFWRFALGVYKPQSHRTAFLRAQDEGGADVPLLLFCLWSGAEGIRLSTDAMGAAVSFSAAWREARVEPLRALRRGWKDAPGPLPPALSESARQKVAAAEQAVERLQMAHLADLRTGEAVTSGATRDNLDLYGTMAGITLDAALRKEIESFSCDV